MSRKGGSRSSPAIRSTPSLAASYVLAAWAAKDCYTIRIAPPERIIETARIIAGGRPASLIHPGRRANWYGDDTQRARAVATLSALLGVRARMACHLASHLHHISGRSASSEILEIARLFLRFRNSPITQICGTSGRQDDKLFLRGP